ncbi:MAG: hypothetical protein GC178_15990 [Flavobacteriales bacterium]|nr:hypothetical protein [Flavobacteriales bacterium]
MISDNDLRIDFSFDCKEGKRSFIHIGKDDYCKRCACMVRDVRNMSRQEIQQLLDANHGELCAQFYLDQVDTTSGHRPTVSLSMVAAGLTTLLTLASSQQAMAQAAPPGMERHYEAEKPRTNPTERPQTAEQSQKPSEPKRESKKPKTCTAAVETKEEKEVYRSRRLFKLGRLHVFSTEKFPFIRPRIRSRRRGKVLYVR